MAFIFCRSLIFFSKLAFLKKKSGMPSLDPDQARPFVELYLGPNCLQRLSADDTRRQRVKFFVKNYYFVNLFSVYPELLEKMLSVIYLFTY